MIDSVRPLWCVFLHVRPFQNSLKGSGWWSIVREFLSNSALSVINWRDDERNNGEPISTQSLSHMILQVTELDGSLAPEDLLSSPAVEPHRQTPPPCGAWKPWYVTKNPEFSARTQRQWKLCADHWPGRITTIKTHCVPGCGSTPLKICRADNTHFDLNIWTYCSMHAISRSRLFSSHIKA